MSSGQMWLDLLVRFNLIDIFSNIFSNTFFFQLESKISKTKNLLKIRREYKWSDRKAVMQKNRDELSCIDDLNVRSQ